MNVLVLNCGSSSVKYRVYAMPEETLLARGAIEKIGGDDAIHQHGVGDHERKATVSCPDHKTALHLVAEALMNDGHGVISEPDEIAAVGHRVVHGGEVFVASVVINDRVEATIRELFPLAPLHNPPNLAGIDGARDAFPHAPQVAVFDTAFHRSMLKHAYMYAIPYELYEKDHLRKYGFHGTSYRYVAGRVAKLMGVPADKLNAVICHLGNGSSMAAVQNGQSVDTSMGFTPLEGLIMGTRSGDIDPGVVLHLMRGGEMTPAAVDRMLNKESGVLGLSGVSNDMRLIESAAAEGNERAQLALDCYHYRVRKYIGAYLAALVHVHAIVFTGGIGERGPESRTAILKGMAALGIVLDEQVNAGCRARETRISTGDSPIQVWVVPTNEELMIARDTYELTAKKKARKKRK